MAELPLRWIGRLSTYSSIRVPDLATIIVDILLEFPTLTPAYLRALNTLIHLRFYRWLGPQYQGHRLCLSFHV